MKVKELSRDKLSSTDRTRSKKRILETEGSGRTFVEEIKRVEAVQWQEKLDQLMQSIDEQAERLQKNQTVRELQIYKNLVREFLQETTGSNYRKVQESRWDRRGNLRVLTVIAEIDQQLGELTHLVMQEQKDPLKILQKLGEIRGILVDLYG
ncbi:MAG: YaaR family protein [Syntrophomonadaceae bacterium]|nr:YaaR family protein [Syntrophomonadaceae bacterium]